MSVHKKNNIDISNSVTSIPLFPPSARQRENEKFLGHLNGAVDNIRQILRAELSLAKIEIFKEVKKSILATAMFAAAGIFLLFAGFFFFITLALIINAFFLPLWASFLIVFLLMLVFTIGAVSIGIIIFKKVKKNKYPENTISTLKSTAAIPAAIRTQEKQITASF